MATLTTHSRTRIASPLSQAHRSEQRFTSVQSDDTGSTCSSTNEKPGPAYLDGDLQSMVKTYVRDFRKRHRVSQVPLDMVNQISLWLCKQLQQERHQWNIKLQEALKQVEAERRRGLEATSLLQICTERLHMLVQCCSLHKDPDTLMQVSGNLAENPQQVVLSYTQTLMEVFTHLVEDHLQSMELLNSAQYLPENILQLSLTNQLRQRLSSDEKVKSELMSKSQQSIKDKQKTATKTRQNQALETMVRGLESEVGKLRLVLKKERDKLSALEEVAESKSTLKKKVHTLEQDLNRLKNLHNKKQDYIDWLKKQFVELTKVVEDDQSVLNNEGHSEIHRVKTQLPSPKGEGNTREITVTLTQSPNSVKSAGTNTSSSTNQSVEISEEKLNVLKMKATKLEDSLKKAMKQMSDYAEKLSKTSQSQLKDENCLDLKSKGVILKMPKKVNVLKDIVRKSVTTKTGDSSDTPRKAKLDKSFKELQNSFANRYGHSRKIGKSASDVSASVNSNRKNQVSKCFRCRKIFRPSDNHKLSCCFHVKGKERTETYGEDGKLKHVTFVWQCCGQSLESAGCCTGYHV